MDPKLAEIYGTNQDADLEKLAAAELAEGLADDGQLDTDGLSEEELEAVAQDVLNGEGEGQEKVSADEAQEKLAEADYLGRVMAHSYVKELRSIEKTAAYDVRSDEHSARRGAQHELGSAMEKDLMSDAEKGSKSLMNKARGAAKRGSNAIESGANRLISKATPHAEKGLAFAKRHKGKGAIGALALGGGLAAKKMMSKKSSAMDTLVEQRAQAILEASGIDPDGLQAVSGQEKVSDPREALASAVDERAWALLGQFGVVPNEQE